jgi:hypothetical protein
MKALLSAISLFLTTCVALADPAPSVVPLTLTHSDHEGGRVYLPVRLGTVSGSMRLDTGASTSRVALAPWNRDLPRLGESRSTGAAGQAALCDDVEARNVQLEASTGNNVARGKYEMTRCAGGDDLLGLDFFRGTRFSLDFHRREMIVFGQTRQDARFAPFRTLGSDRLIGLPVRIGDAATVGLFDTGAEISAVDQRFVDAHRKLFAPVQSRIGASAAGGGKIESKLYRIRQIALPDGRVVKGLYALAYDFGPLREALGRDVATILGYNFISRFDWDLDLTEPASPRWSARSAK